MRRWRNRWAAAEVRLHAAEQENASDKDFAALIRGVLSDEPRPGGPCTFSAEQLTQIIAVACEVLAKPFKWTYAGKPLVAA